MNLETVSQLFHNRPLLVLNFVLANLHGTFTSDFVDRFTVGGGELEHIVG